MELKEIENVIISNLVFNEEYARKTLPFIESEYFQDPAQRIVFDKIEKFFSDYNKSPTLQALAIDLSNDKTISEGIYDQVVEIVAGLKSTGSVEFQWLVKNTEKFCKDRSVFNCVMNAISIIDGKDKKRAIDAIPDMMQKALAVSFDSNIGHRYLHDVEHRWEYYHKKEYKIPTGVELLDKVTGGGVSKKTLNVFMGGTGVGKTLVMCAIASNMLLAGYNILYITKEMSEEEIGKRIDANLLNIPMGEFNTFPKDIYYSKVERLKGKMSNNELIVKEFPTGAGHVGHFRHIVNELKQKQNFVPDVIFVDYINICASIRFKHSAVGMYAYVKSIAEELRGFAVELDVPIISATQTNREGFKSSDPGIGDTSESFGLPATCDFFAVLISSEQLDQLGQIIIKQEKSRYGDVNYFRRMGIGIEKQYMRLTNLDPSAQQEIAEMPGEYTDTPVMDLSRFTTDEFPPFNKGISKGKLKDLTT